MLNWSNTIYKLTLGVGALGMVILMRVLLIPVLPVWCALAIALLPVGVFLVFRPGIMNARIVRYAHVAASIWYLCTASFLVWGAVSSADPATGWVCAVPFLAIGLVPCFIVLWKVLQGSYEFRE
jgi:hypothetical protein